MPDSKRIAETEKRKLSEVLEKVKVEETKLDNIRKQYVDLVQRMKPVKSQAEFVGDGIFFRDKEGKVIGHLKVIQNTIAFNGSFHESAKQLFEALQDKCKVEFDKNKRQSEKKLKAEITEDFDELKDNFESANTENERLNDQLKQKTETAEILAGAKEELEKNLSEAEARMNEVESELIKEREANQQAITAISELEGQVHKIQKMKIEDSPEYQRMKHELTELRKQKKA